MHLCVFDVLAENAKTIHTLCLFKAYDLREIANYKSVSFRQVRYTQLGMTNG